MATKIKNKSLWTQNFKRAPIDVLLLFVSFSRCPILTKTPHIFFMHKYLIFIDCGKKRPQIIEMYN